MRRFDVRRKPSWMLSSGSEDSWGVIGWTHGGAKWGGTSVRGFHHG